MRQALQNLQEFHETFRLYYNTQPTGWVPEEVAAIRVKLLEEELDEYRQAAAAGDLVEIADALTDLLYVLLGTVVAHGLQGYAQALFDEVHRSNMSKLDPNGQPVLREDGKVLKSTCYFEPDIAGVLAGLRPEAGERA